MESVGWKRLAGQCFFYELVEESSREVLDWYISYKEWGLE